MTFRQWIKTQTKRDDPIGDLAKDIRDDREPSRLKVKDTLESWIGYLRVEGACSDCIKAFRKAWKEYEQQ